MGKFKDIWNKDKDGKKKEQRSFLRFAIVATVIFIAFLFLKKDNVIRWIQAGITIDRQEKQIEKMRGDINRLDEQINLMTTNCDTLEKFAREKYNFTAAGEDIYIVE